MSPLNPTGPELTILAPMRLEARAVRAGAPWARVERTGIGPRRAGRAARRNAVPGAAPVLVAGVCGGLDERLAPGDIVLADALVGASGRLPCPDPTVLAGVLRRGGLRVHVGPIASSPKVVTGSARRELAAAGALAVEMESLAIARALSGRAPHVLRVVLDTPSAELHRPVRLGRAAVEAFRTLRAAAGLLHEFAAVLGRRDVVLATPRASCAGVERAVEIVERVLRDRGAPVYVRKQIVHNAHVIADLERRGAVFVDEIDDVPEGATVIFSAHGVSPAVRARATERGLEVIDATCPLVAKVHAEARRFSARGFDIVLVGHEGHEEVEGTFGEAPERTHVVASADEVDGLELADPDRVAYLTQTTLAQDDTATVVEALRDRFPALVGPRSSDICYATQNRQDAVRALAGDCELVLVIGSGNSSNSRRLVEVSERAGARAVLIEDGGEITPELVAGVRRVGVTAGASAPEVLVQEAVQVLAGLGEVTVSERRVATEDVYFKLPVAVRGGE
jgi:4-hydroxy-3-methylbut-2-enyl diphosphate reductase